jgi:uracil-DNA glycosylase
MSIKVGPIPTIPESDTIFPPKSKRFRAFELTAPDDVRVVILGQDPYHTPGVANGLAFSTDEPVLPPSLGNIFRELVDDVRCDPPTTGDLSPWAKQGVLLLNTALTVEKGKPSSHLHLWQEFTKTVIAAIVRERPETIWVLWGRKAQSLLLGYPVPTVTSPHPSPLSAYSGFFGSKPFSKVNRYLSSISSNPIDWRLP